jgi:hypothetical protein
MLKQILLLLFDSCVALRIVSVEKLLGLLKGCGAKIAPLRAKELYARGKQQVEIRNRQNGES